MGSRIGSSISFVAAVLSVGVSLLTTRPRPCQQFDLRKLERRRGEQPASACKCEDRIVPRSPCKYARLLDSKTPYSKSELTTITEEHSATKNRHGPSEQEA
jgi:hypothetical protein